jgi:hypothetical protein
MLVCEVEPAVSLAFYSTNRERCSAARVTVIILMEFNVVKLSDFPVLYISAL